MADTFIRYPQYTNISIKYWNRDLNGSDFDNILIIYNIALYFIHLREENVKNEYIQI